MRTALYLRVSTKPAKSRKPTPGEQTVENQRIKLREFAKAMDWTIVAEYEDRESGAKAGRPGFTALMDAAARREFDAVLVWSLDRFSREGIGKTCDHLKRLAGYRVAFRSYSEPFLDTTGDFGELVAAIFAFVASFERKRIIERTLAGMERARRQGKLIGRPRSEVDRDLVLRLHHQEGVSIRRIAKELKTSATTVHRLLKT
ncbi:MAG TPA: recombinase family protein [Bryobacteraceae bacterium]|nr:recombinase family protein [Bryobacteraceae bacterium]